MKNAAIVLSGGGALGAAHIGVLKYLEAAGYRFDYVAGVSAGSIVGALIADGKSTADILDIMQTIRLPRMALDLTRSDYGVLSGDKLHDFIKRHLGDRDIEELALPLCIGATDFTTGERVLLRSGKIADAVRSSCSIPAVFTPYFHKGQQRWLVDGFLTQNLPLDVAIAEYKGDTIFAIDVGSSFSQEVDFTAKHWLLGAGNIKKTVERMFRMMLWNQRKSLPQDDRVIHIIPRLEAFSSMDYLKLDKIVTAGEAAAEAAMSG